MFNNDKGYTLADIAAVTGRNDNDGWGGDSSAWWIILLFLLVGGNGFGGFGGYGANGAMLYPWMNQADITTSGFQNSAIAGQLNGIQGGIYDLSTQLCNSTAGITQSMAAGFANAETAANARQMANMQQGFGMQTAITGGLENLSAQFANCCCENRLANADLKYTIATENCADRNTSTQNTQAILTAINGGIQSIKDQLCQDKIDEKNDIIAQLRQEALYARGQASQDVQTARILAGQTAEIDALYNRLDACPVGTTPVYGKQPIFTCPQTLNSGCGCGSF